MIGLALTKEAAFSQKVKSQKKRKTEHTGQATKKRKVDLSSGASEKKNKKEEDVSDAAQRRKRHLLFRREVEEIKTIDDFPLPTEEQGNAFLLGITGRRKSGKTFLLDKLIKTIWKGLFDKIYVLSLTAKRQKQYFGTWEGNIQYLDKWDANFFDSVVQELENNPGQKHLIVIDDMSSDMREKLYACNIDRFSFIGRHWGASVVWLGQKITLFTPGFRQESDGFIIFREENMAELRLLHREWGFGDMNYFICQLLENTMEKYSWLMLRNLGGTIHIKIPPKKDDQSNFVDELEGKK